jgi:hypothetical protein
MLKAYGATLVTAALLGVNLWHMWRARDRQFAPRWLMNLQFVATLFLCAMVAMMPLRAPRSLFQLVIVLAVGTGLLARAALFRSASAPRTTRDPAVDG